MGKITEYIEVTDPDGTEWMYSINDPGGAGTSRKVQINTLLKSFFNSVNVKSFGAKGDGVTDDTANIQTALTTGKNIFFPSGTYIISSTLTMEDNQAIIGVGWASIIDISAINQLDDGSQTITTGTGCQVSDLKFLGDATSAGTLNLIGLDDDSIASNLYFSYGSGGIDCVGINLTINKIKAENIRATTGWAVVIHGSSPSVNDVYIDGVYAKDCDRGIEFEDGAMNVYAQNGYLENIFPAEGETYSFVLDAHSHSGEGVTSNINYENFYVKNSGPLTADGNTGAVKKISFKNIVIDTLRAGKEGILIADATDISLSKISFVTTTGGQYGISIDDSSNIYITDSQFEDFAALIEPIYCKNTTVSGIFIRRCLFKNILGNVIYCFTATNLIISDSIFDNNTGIAVYATALTGLRLFNNNFNNLIEYVTRNDLTTLTSAIITNNSFTPKSTTSSPYTVSINATKTLISGNTFNNFLLTGGMQLHASCEDVVVIGNVFIADTTAPGNYSFYDNGSERAVISNNVFYGVPNIVAINTKGTQSIIGSNMIQNNDIWIRSTASGIHTIGNTLQNGSITEEAGGLANHTETANITL